MTTSSSIRESMPEHSRLTIRLRPESVAALRSPTFAKRLSIAPDFAAGSFTISSDSFIGRVVVPGFALSITPKIRIRHVLAMIRPERMSKGLRAELEGYAEDDLADAVASMYQRSVADALARGMRRNYEPRHESLVAPRGRIDVAKQIRSPLVTPVACSYEDYTLDNPHNRLLKAALNRVLRIDSVSGTTRSSVLRTLQWFGEVSDRCPDPEALLRKGFTRLNRHYETPCRLAHLILDGSAISEAIGPRSANTFLLDMNKVFEEFVEDRMRPRLPPQLRLTAQALGHLDVDRRVPIRPDLVLQHGRRVVMVADVKYKRPVAHEGNESDLYQAISYATALGTDRALLIYATHEARAPIAVRMRNGIQISVSHLNLADPKTAIDKLMQNVADAVGHASWSSGPPRAPSLKGA